MPAARTADISIDVVIPVLNEAHVLADSVARVSRYLEASLPYRWQLVIVDNGSTDGTHEIARSLAENNGRVRLLRLNEPGRGRALRLAWLQSDAAAVCYMDVDLSTDLDEIPRLLRAVVEEGYDIAVGSRLAPGSRVRRSFKREMISRLYNLFLKLVLSTGFSDAQTGFKALTRDAVQRIVPQVEDESWFFDTELLALAESQGLRIKDMPIVWSEADDSRVKILRTAWDDIRGAFRVRRRLRGSRRAADGVVVSPRRRAG